MATLDDLDNPTGHLIAARRVQGAKVYNAALEELGSLDDVVIDKISGRIAYAVLTAGGFLGMGATHYPLPWEKLRYDTEMGGYIGRLLDDRLLEAVQKLRPLAQQAGCTMAQFALAWILRQPNVASAIIGASRPEQVSDNARASGLAIDPALFTQAEAIISEARA